MSRLQDTIKYPDYIARRKFTISPGGFSAALSQMNSDHPVFLYDKDGRLRRLAENIEPGFLKIPQSPGLKELLFPPRKMVVSTDVLEKDIVICGVRNCELRSKHFLDLVFTGNTVFDKSYSGRAKKLKMITFDCASPASSCFCIQTGGSSFNDPSETSFLNVTRIEENRLLITTGPDFSNEYMKYFDFTAADEKDTHTAAEIKEHSDAYVGNSMHSRAVFDLISILKENNNLPDLSKIEKDIESCISCGGCTFICPTCYSFALADSSSVQQPKTFQQWDSCQYPGYSDFMNNKFTRLKRFIYRYRCKLGFMMDNNGTSGCTGCGRCIETCPAGIDMRTIIEKIVEYMKKQR